MGIKCYGQLYHYISQVGTIKRWLASAIVDSGGIPASPDKFYDSIFLHYTFDYAMPTRRSQARRRLAGLESLFYPLGIIWPLPY